ncbi:hypothetical protein HDU91_004852, partial [Kappamyces sp. JEL0680]
MKFATIATALLSLASALPAATDKTNYQMLVDAINAFQLTSDYSFQLILAALSQQKNLLNSYSTSM